MHTTWSWSLAKDDFISAYQSVTELVMNPLLAAPSELISYAM